MGLDHRPWWWLPNLVKGTGRDAIGAIGTALVIIGRYASFSISGGLSLLLLVSASGYAFASTGAYGSLAGSNPKTNRFDRPGLGWWIEWILNCVITAAIDVQPFFLFSLFARNRTHSTSNSIGWAYPFFSSFFSFFDFEKIPRIVFYRHRLLTLLVRSSYPKSFPNRLVLCPRSPFPGEGEKVLQADAAKNLVESRNEDCDDYLN